VPLDQAAVDRDVRLHLYRAFLASGRPPTHRQTATAVGITPDDAAAAYRRLAEGHVIVLHPGTLDVWMANPLSAVPTAFRVVAEGRSYFGNCVWDALGVLAMLHTDGHVDATCPDCREPLRLVVEAEALVEAEGIVHFGIPAGRWWEDIGAT
jgi:Alkylmercury lyase